MRRDITNVGYWIPQQSVPAMDISAENTFIDMRGYPSREERDKRVKARGDDPEFDEVVTPSEWPLHGIKIRRRIIRQGRRWQMSRFDQRHGTE